MFGSSLHPLRARKRPIARQIDDAGADRAQRIIVRRNVHQPTRNSGLRVPPGIGVTVGK
jgi:hypothetical protein